jgi:hypothetical protein
LVVRPLIFTQRFVGKGHPLQSPSRKLAGRPTICPGSELVEQPRSDVDVVAQKIVVLDQGLSGVDRGPETSVEGWGGPVPALDGIPYAQRSPHGLGGGRESQKEAISEMLDNLSVRAATFARRSRSPSRSEH